MIRQAAGWAGADEAGSAGRVRDYRRGVDCGGGGRGLWAVPGGAVLLAAVPPEQWGQVGLGVGATFLRVLVALLLALAWTIPVGVAIGTNRRLAAVLQPLVQITASIPATALFPVILSVRCCGCRAG